MRKLSLVSLILVIFLILFFSLPGCRYVFFDVSEIQEELEVLTPIGTNHISVANILNSEFGKQSFLFKGQAELDEKGWKSLGINNTMDLSTLESGFFLTYELGTHVSTLIVLPTVVSASWYFNKDGSLANIKVTKTVDGL